MKKKTIIITIMVVLTILIPIQPVKAGDLDYTHIREFDYLHPYNADMIWFSLNVETTIHWEFTTILDDMIINASFRTQHADPYWIEYWYVSSNKTHDFGNFTLSPEVPYTQYQFRWENLGNTSGYIMADIWYGKKQYNVDPLWNYYVLPNNRTQPLWEFKSFNNPLQQYDAVYTSFKATKYDAFFLGSYPYVAPILFLDQAGFNYLNEHKNPYDSNLNALYPHQSDFIRPTHNDTWYFVFMNGYIEEGVNLNVAIRFTPNYYGYPPPEPDPEPDPEPQEPQLKEIFIVVILVGIIAIIGVIYKIIRYKSNINY